MANGGDGCRRNRTQEVAGSSPASSTTERPASVGLSLAMKETESAENGLVVRFWSSRWVQRSTRAQARARNLSCDRRLLSRDSKAFQKWAIAFGVPCSTWRDSAG